MTAACLHGARLGMLVLLWDILCPVCRIPSEVQESLKALRDHGRCDVCRLDYQLDFANSVEMIFRAHPELRDSELATYCVGGPAHSPHVVAQARLAPGERIELDLALAEGAYCLRGPQLPYTLEFRADAGARATRWDLLLSRSPGAGLPRVLKAGAQSLALTNDHNDELVVRVERTAPRADALTAARASALALFRELFPGEVLSPGRLVSVTTLTFLVGRLAGADDLYRALGDARAFGVFHEMFRGIEEVVRGEGGAVVKTVGEGVLAVFSDPLAAVRTAFAVAPRLAASAETRELRLRLAVHRGPALAATLNDHLDYFGTTVSRALRLVESGPAGVVLTTEVAADPGVAAFVGSRVAPILSNDDDLLLHRFPSS
jgi:class 3 adenylate cyclase